MSCYHTWYHHHHHQYYYYHHSYHYHHYHYHHYYHHSYHYHHFTKDTEVQARQTLNAELALRLSETVNREDSRSLGIGLYEDDDDDGGGGGMKWLLHIDIDEVFYTNDDDVSSHFRYLDSVNVDSMTYMNHEGVPEDHDSNDYLVTTTLFRRHHFSLPITAAVDKALSYWRNRTQYSQYFLVYDNGKSAVKVNVSAVPKDVHKWHSSTSSGSFNRKTAIADPRNLDVNELLVLNDGPCILHYVTCGFRWLTDKYKVLGNFPDHWFGGLLPIAPSFHLKSRDIVNKTDLAKEYYRKEIQFSVDTFDNDSTSYQQEYHNQLESQILMRVTRVSDIIKIDREKRCLELGIHLKDNESVNVNILNTADVKVATGESIIPPVISINPPVAPLPPVTENVAEMDKLRILSQVSQMWF